MVLANVVVLKRETKFDEFWLLYPSPRRTGKAMCRAKWDAITGPTGLRTRTLDRDSNSFINLVLSATPEEIIEGLKRSCMRWRRSTPGGGEWKDDGQFIPNPSTWLNQGRWED